METRPLLYVTLKYKEYLETVEKKKEENAKIEESKSTDVNESKENLKTEDSNKKELNEGQKEIDEKLKEN